MELVPESGDIGDYLRADEHIDLHHASIQQKTGELLASLTDERGRIRTLFEYVRDGILHSRDVNSKRVTVCASEVLEHKEGICISKSLLLAAMLRCAGIPAGLCYQRLTVGDTPDTGYIIHGLNAVFLSDEKRWIRLDARGNKEGVDAQFSVDEERIAFPIEAEHGEKDFPTIHSRPPRSVMDHLKSIRDPWEYSFDIQEL